MHVEQYLGLAENAEKNLAKAFGKVKMQHAFEPDVVEMCEKFLLWTNQHLEHIDRLAEQYKKEEDDEAEEIAEALFTTPRMGAFGMLRDLHGLWLLVHEAQICWIILHQAAQALRDASLESVCRECGEHSKRETMWLLTKIKSAAPQVLVVAD